MKKKIVGIDVTDLPRRPYPPTVKKLLVYLEKKAPKGKIFPWQDICRLSGASIRTSPRYLAGKEFEQYRLRLYGRLYLGNSEAIAKSKKLLRSRGEIYED